MEQVLQETPLTELRDAKDALGGAAEPAGGETTYLGMLGGAALDAGASGGRIRASGAAASASAPLSPSGRTGLRTARTLGHFQSKAIATLLRGT